MCSLRAVLLLMMLICHVLELLLSRVHVDDVCCGCGEAVKNESCDETMPTSKVDVSYFRNLIRTETDRLTVLCAVWRSTMEDTSDLSDEGSLRLIVYFNFVDLAVGCPMYTSVLCFQCLSYFSSRKLNSKVGNLCASLWWKFNQILLCSQLHCLL